MTRLSAAFSSSSPTVMATGTVRRGGSRSVARTKRTIRR
jgi:hypothetical protein